MSDVKRLVASILSFLRTQLGAGLANSDAAESLEVGIQCLESAFELKSEDMQTSVDLLELFKKNYSAPPQSNGVSEEVKAEAEALKNEGNNLMKAEQYSEALQKYTKAIQLNSKNAIFYCNRAAAHYYLNNTEASIQDCNTAISLNPQYGRAYGRLGLAFTKLNRHLEAKNAFQKASQLEPENETHRNNLQLAETTLSQGTNAPPMDGGLDLGSLLQNPALMNVATQMLSDPEMQTLMSSLLGNVSGPQNMGNSTGINALLQAGQQLAQHMQRANPQLVEQLRSQMTGTPDAPGNPPQQPPSDQHPPNPPQ